MEITREGRKPIETARANKETLMAPYIIDEKIDNTILDQIQEGMRVYDYDGRHLGKVRRVILGAVSDEAGAPGRGPATAGRSSLRKASLIENVAETLAAEEPLPETLRERLLRHGYIQIDTAGLLASDRIALPDQIESVSNNSVWLGVAQEDLFKY